MRVNLTANSLFVCRLLIIYTHNKEITSQFLFRQCNMWCVTLNWCPKQKTPPLFHGNILRSSLVTQRGTVKNIQNESHYITTNLHPHLKQHRKGMVETINRQEWKTGHEQYVRTVRKYCCTLWLTGALRCAKTPGTPTAPLSRFN